MFTYKVIELHGRLKYEIVYTEGGKHVAYLNDEQECKTLVRLLNTSKHFSVKKGT